MLYHFATFSLLLASVQYALVTSLPAAWTFGPEAPHHKDTKRVDHHLSGGDEHIVIFSTEAPAVDEVLNRIDLTPSHSDVLHIFSNSAFRGFVARMKSHCISNLLNMSDILHVEESIAISSFDTVATRLGSPWGLQRISSASTVSGDERALDFAYAYSNVELGNGVDIYIVDTGIDVDNAAFGGKARMGFSFEQDSTDQNGHGTHVSGTAASYLFGVAPGANLIGVKVLGADGAGTTSSTVAGMDYVINQHEARSREGGFVGSIMSMSWGLSSVSPAIDTTLRAAMEQGIHAAVAAGNSAQNACAYSPASSGGMDSGAVVTVGSIAEDNAISSFSNTGPCVDIYAPGENILSTWLGANTVNYLSGTSMATPHVTGVMAYLMVMYSDLANNPRALKSKLLELSLHGIVTGDPITGDPMRLLNNGIRDATGTEGLLGGGV